MELIGIARFANIIFSWIGAYVAGGWARDKVQALAERVDMWSRRRAQIKILQAIVDYELSRGVHMYAALDYAVGFALPGYVRAEWRER